MNSSDLAKQEVIFQVPATSEKIYIREQKGHFQRIRRFLNILLITLFVLLPWVSYKDRQAILFDIGAQQLNVFHFTFFPHDLMLFALIFISAAFGLFWITKRYGRVWCGFACPQTVWTLMFNWLERRVEGNHSKSRALDAQSMSLHKIVVKTTKHSLWLMLSLFTSLVFLSYFEPANNLYRDFFTGNATALINGWVLFFTACTYVNGGWLREKMCQHVCPYSRFQSAMFDNATKLVAYNANRGESRGPRSRKVKPDNMGDCVDCNLCVQVCPVGIDIRAGLQYECINCGLCIDACDDVMQKFGYPKRLIAFAQEKLKSKNRLGQLGYGIVGILTVGALLGWFFVRQETEVSVIRDRQALYRLNESGHLENTYQIKVLNKSQQVKRYRFQLQGLSDVYYTTVNELTVLPGEHGILALSAASAAEPKHLITDIHLLVTELNSGVETRKETVFIRN